MTFKSCKLLKKVWLFLCLKKGLSKIFQQDKKIIIHGQVWKKHDILHTKSTQIEKRYLVENTKVKFLIKEHNDKKKKQMLKNQQVFKFLITLHIIQGVHKVFRQFKKLITKAVNKISYIDLLYINQCL